MISAFYKDWCKDCKLCEQFLHIEGDFYASDFRGTVCNKESEKRSCYDCRHDEASCGRDGKWFEKGKIRKKFIRSLEGILKTEFDEEKITGKCTICGKEGDDLTIKLSFTDINRSPSYAFCDGKCLGYWIDTGPTILMWY